MANEIGYAHNEEDDDDEREREKRRGKRLLCSSNDQGRRCGAHLSVGPPPSRPSRVHVAKIYTASVIRHAVHYT